jgi:hypothetical protein
LLFIVLIIQNHDILTFDYLMCVMREGSCVMVVNVLPKTLLVHPHAYTTVKNIGTTQVTGAVNVLPRRAKTPKPSVFLSTLTVFSI